MPTFSDKPGKFFGLGPKAPCTILGIQGQFYTSVQEFVHSQEKKHPEWKNHSDLLKLAMRLRYSNNIADRSDLLATSGKLTYLNPDDPVLGVKHNGKGKNLYGRALEEVREEFRGPWCDHLPWTKFQEVRSGPSKTDNPIRGFVNSRYQVFMESYTSEYFADKGAVVGLTIQRLDHYPLRDWRDLQRIKNELVCPEAEAAELYPDEGRLVDTVNECHLWVLPTGSHFPFGFTERTVVDGLAHYEEGVNHQRPFPPEERPPDAVSLDEFKRTVR